ncbi:MAG: hypothetical protein OHK0017_01960 [Patescibacteria group bacterium]
MFLRGFNVAFSSLVILTSAAGCTFQNPFGGNSQSATNYGVVKVVGLNGERKIGAVNFLEQTDPETGETNTTRGLATISGLDLVSSGRNDEFYFLSGSGLFKTSNGGQAWRRQYLIPIKSDKGTAEERNAERQQLLQQNNAINLTSIAVDSSNPDIIYVSGTANKIGKIYKSQDGGANFKEIYSEVSNDVAVTNLVVNPNDSRQVYGVLARKTILKSADGGSTWQKVRTFQPGSGNIVQLGFIKQFDNKFFVLLDSAGLAFSPDEGNNWDPVLMRRVDSKIGEAQPQDALSLEAGNSNKFGNFEKLIPVTATKGEYLLLADKQLWITRDITKAWFKVNLPLQGEQNQITALTYDPVAGSDKMYVTIQNKLFVTSNTGTSWSSETLPVNAPVTKMLIDPFSIDNMYLMLAATKK